MIVNNSFCPLFTLFNLWFVERRNINFLIGFFPSNYATLEIWKISNSIDQSRISLSLDGISMQTGKDGWGKLYKNGKWNGDDTWQIVHVELENGRANYCLRASIFTNFDKILSNLSLFSNFVNFVGPFQIQQRCPIRSRDVSL